SKPGVAVAISTVSTPPSLASTEELAPKPPKCASRVARALIAMVLPRKKTTSTSRPYWRYRPASRPTQNGVRFGPVEPKASTACSSFCARTGSAIKQSDEIKAIRNHVRFISIHLACSIANFATDRYFSAPNEKYTANDRRSNRTRGDGIQGHGIVFYHEEHEVREKHCSFLRALRGEWRIQDNIPTA